MDFSNTTTTMQGSIGLGIAIGYFATKRYTVLLPLIDNQNYDLVVDTGSKLEKIQVKTTGYKEKDKKTYTVQLRSMRHNKTANRSIKFDGKIVDWLFVVTETSEQYLIPAAIVDGKYAICLGEKYDQFKVT